MFHLRILSVKKIKEDWLEEAIGEFIKRMKPIAHLECIWAKNDQQLLALAAKEPHLICLDASGQMMDSEEFSCFLLKKLEVGKAHLTLLIGGADGLPPELKNNRPLISLSRLTFTHQMVRLLLIEQIYRAFEIYKGTKYHK